MTTYRPATDDEIAEAVAEAAKWSDRALPPTDPDCARQVIALIRQLGGMVNMPSPNGVSSASKPDSAESHGGIVHSCHSDRWFFWDTEGDGKTTLAVEPEDMEDGMTMDLVVRTADLLPLARQVADEHGYAFVREGEGQ